MNLLHYHTDLGYAMQIEPKLFYYGKEYFEHYKQLEGTKIEKRLNKFRVELVQKYGCRCVLDFGIGAGTFLSLLVQSTKSKAYGYDVNSVGEAWLKERGWYANPWINIPTDVDAWAFFDVLEHLINPAWTLGLVSKGHHAFVSMPIFPNLLEITKSKHYKPGEHTYYFTHWGFLRYVAVCGFEVVEETDEETKIGRQGIMTFVLKKTE